MADCLVIGGGVIGLSIAYELACLGRSVLVVERGEVGKEASWAGAGILPPPTARGDVPAWPQLQSLSFRLHEQLQARLKDETGIDNGYRRCGGIHVARRAGEAAALRADMAELAADGVKVQRIESFEQLNRLEPNLELPGQTGSVAAYLLPDEAQIRNPRHLQALTLACRQRGVRIVSQRPISRFQFQEDRVASACSGGESFEADNFVIASGAWSEELLQMLNLNISIYPVRGQMLLFQCEQPPVQHIINEGPRYIVPRSDGRVLIGSTEEDVGFDKQTTEAGLEELRSFAETVVPCLKSARLEQSWAGLRPHAVDGFPHIGRVPHLSNCFVAAGHYRAGLSTSTGTARVMRQLIEGEPTSIDIDEFRLNR